MHIKRNVFENIFNTVMNVKGKTENNMNAKINVSLFFHHKNIELNIPLFCHHNNLHTQHMEKLEKKYHLGNLQI